jgi:2',3'-cyclic-nucleotide 2'-phosphodiesterase (5'-nucleotidase family)
LIGASLVACSSHFTILPTSGKTAILENNQDQTDIKEVIQPYKDSVEKVMSTVLATTAIDFESGRPNSLLGNWTADALFANQTRTVRMSEPVFCLLSVGGLRSAIGKGNVTRGDIFRLMPFDNQVVWMRMPIASLTKIEAYLNQSGGEPISNAQLIQGKLVLNGIQENTTHFWVITSDYLANGGDRMDFFLDAIDRQQKPQLLRDIFMSECQLQGELIASPEKRIQLK